MTAWVMGIVRPVLIDKVERDHRQSDTAFQRRRIVVGITLAVSATVLGLSFSVPQGDPAFYALTFALAAVWTLGSVLSGPLYLGHVMLGGTLRRPIITPVAVGLLLAALFVLGAVIARTLPPLARLAEDVLGYARQGNLWLIVVIALVNGVAEELFFRGALFAAIGVHPVLISTVLYTLITVAGGNPMLVVAAAGLGAVAALQRRAGGGVLAPILTHLTWSLCMLLVLPPIFAGGA